MRGVRMKIKEMAELDKPRERLLSVGASNLSNEELISIILKTGTKGKNVKDLSLNVLSEFKELSNLQNATINKLIKINGIGKVKAIELLASLELGKRVYYKKTKEDIILNNTQKVYDYFKDIFYGETQENFYAVYLDTKNRIISYKLLFKGTINHSIVHPREVFKYALYDSATSIIVMHNHPSGDTTPSKPDIELTNNLLKAGELLGIPVLDHIIISEYSYYSFYENMHKNNIKS